MRQFKVVLILVIIFFIRQSIKAQDSKNSNQETTFSLILDRYKNVSSTKEGVDRQLNELSELQKNKISEIQNWESVIADLNKIILERQALTLNVDIKWREIDELSKNNQNGKNNNSIVEGIYEITSGFDINISNDPFDEASEINKFKTELNDGVNQEINKLVKSINLISLAKNLNRISSRGQDLSTDSRVSQLLQLKNEFSNSIYQELNKKVIELLKNKKTEAEKLKVNSNLELSKITEYYDNISKAKEENNKSINQEAIRWGLPFFCITVIVLFYGAFFYRKLSVTQNAQPGQVEQDQISKVLLEIITVLLLTMTVLILGLSGILKENVLGTLLGAIGGYILNRTKDK